MIFYLSYSYSNIPFIFINDLISFTNLLIILLKIIQAIKIIQISIFKNITTLNLYSIMSHTSIIIFKNNATYNKYLLQKLIIFLIINDLTKTISLLYFFYNHYNISDFL